MIDYEKLKELTPVMTAMDLTGYKLNRPILKQTNNWGYPNNGEEYIDSLWMDLKVIVDYRYKQLELEYQMVLFYLMICMKRRII